MFQRLPIQTVFLMQSTIGSIKQGWDLTIERTNHGLAGWKLKTIFLGGSLNFRKSVLSSFRMYVTLFSSRIPVAAGMKIQPPTVTQKATKLQIFLLGYWVCWFDDFGTFIRQRDNNLTLQCGWLPAYGNEKKFTKFIWFRDNTSKFTMWT